MNNSDNINDINENSNTNYSRSNVNLNIALSNPGLNVNDSMSVNINSNHVDEEKVSNLSNVNQSMINTTNNQSYNYTQSDVNQPEIKNNYTSNVQNNNNVFVNNINEQKIDKQQDISNNVQNINNYEKNFDLNVTNQSVEFENKNNNIISFNQANNIRREEKKVKFDNDELKFIVLVTLIIFIIIMFFPNISKFFSNLFYN